MRKVFTAVLLFYLILHFFAPIIYYHFFGFVNLYSKIHYDIYVFKGAVLNIVSIIGTIIVIQFLPDKKTPILPVFDYAFIFYIVCMGFFVTSLCLSGGYGAILKGSLHGALISYILLFFNASSAIGLFLFLQKKIKYVGIFIVLYVVIFALAGSRSSIILMIIYSLILPMFANFQEIKHKLKRFILFFSLISPILFFYGTSVRGAVDESTFLNLIVGRISLVETSGIPIEAKEKKTMDEKLFNKKYSMNNQLQQCLNEISPIDPFKHDVNPNQYYRAVFLGATEASTLDSYMSMNLTLPTYIYLKTNFVLSLILTIIFLSTLYYIWVIKSDNLYFLIGIILSLYTLLQYFDWVLIVADLFRIVLTIFTLKIFNTIFKICFSRKQIDYS